MDDSEVKVIQIKDRRFKPFIDLPFRLYRDEPFWVPPLKRGMKKMLSGKGNDLFRHGGHAVFIAKRGKRVTARVLCGVHTRMNRKPFPKLWGYFSLFEAEDEQSGSAVMQAAESWCRQAGCDRIIGPWSPDDSEDARGFLVEGFDGPPALMNTYSKQWYPAFFERLGYSKNQDILALNMDINGFRRDKLGRIAELSMRKYGYRVDKADLRNIDREVRDVYTVLKNARGPESTVPVNTIEYLHDFVKSIKPLVVEDFVLIARRNSDDRPMAFVLCLPDYNQALIHLNGRMFPIGFIKFLYYKRKIKRLRIMAQMCDFEFHRMGVMASIYYVIHTNAMKFGYTEGADTSTIGEENLDSWGSVASAGGQVYRRYRYYDKALV